MALELYDCYIFFQVVLAADCSAVTSRMYVTYVRHVCVTTHAPYRGDVTYVTTHALNRGDRACALRHVFFFFNGSGFDVPRL